MKNSIDLHLHLCDILATRNSIMLIGLRRSKQFARSYSFQQKVTKHNDKPKIHRQNYHYSRMEENKLRCIENDRMLPETISGRLDVCQFQSEIALRRQWKLGL